MRVLDYYIPYIIARLAYSFRHTFM